MVGGFSLQLEIRKRKERASDWISQIIIAKVGGMWGPTVQTGTGRGPHRRNRAHEAYVGRLPTTTQKEWSW